MCTKPYFYLIIYFLGLVLFQCQPKIKEGEAYATPSFILDETSLLNLDECVAEVDFIPLIAPKDTLINLSCNVFELVVKDKIYYASKCFKDLSIHSFDLEGEEFMEKILLSQNYAFNTGQIDVNEGVLKLMVYGIEKNPKFNQEDLSTFPFYDVFIQWETGKQKIAKALLSLRNNSYSKGGYFYQVMQQEDWQRALDKSYFGKYEKKLLQAIGRLSEQEDPILLKYKVAF